MPFFVSKNRLSSVIYTRGGFMKKFAYSLILTFALCCCLVGCRTLVPPGPPLDLYAMTIKLDGVEVQYHRADWYGKEIAYAPETVYEMMTPIACTVSGGLHTVFFDFADCAAHPNDPEEIRFSSVDAEGVQVSHQSALINVNFSEYTLEVQLNLTQAEPQELLVLRVMIYHAEPEYSGELFVAMRVAE